MRPLGQRYKHIKRYREIVHVLARHGFGNLIDQLELVPYLSLARRLFRGVTPGPPLTAPERMRLAIEELGQIPLADGLATDLGKASVEGQRGLGRTRD